MVKTAVLLAAMTGLLLAVGAALGGRSGMTVALIMAAVMNFGMFWFSDRVVLKMYRAKPLGPDDVTDRISSLYGVYFAPDDAGGSTIDHSASLIGIGPDGALRVVWPPNVTEQALASDVRALLP